VSVFIYAYNFFVQFIQINFFETLTYENEKERKKIKIERKHNCILIYYFALLCNSIATDVLDLN